MRTIEKKMLAAIEAKKAFNSDNTVVSYCKNTALVSVILHGNHIGTYMHLYSGFRVDLETLKLWPTNTTKSRLRALGCNVQTKKGETFLDGEKV